MATYVTVRQGEILRCIREFHRDRGVPPTVREIEDWAAREGKGA